MIREKTKTILLVEDEAIIALSEEKILTRHGFTVITAYSGEDAVEIFLQSPEIDLVLMDINLGSGMDGTRAAEIILQHREIPLIFLSSHTERDVVEKTEGITSYGYIVKNSGEVVLIASIRMAFRLFEARTKEREKDAALREKQELLRLFIEHAPAALAMFDRDMRYLAVSPRWKSDYCLGDGDFSGRSHYEIFPELPSRWRDVHRRGMEGEAVRGVEDSFQRLDGSVQWLHWEMLPWRDADGAVGGIVIFSEDITDRVHIQEELRNERRRLAERIKELNCLYGISRLIEQPGSTLEGILQGTADLLPRAWQHPEIARARITLDGSRYTSQDFSEGRWRQAAEITVDGAGVGAVEVFYVQAGPECDEGPFLKEERSLINAVAVRMGSLIELKRAEKALEEMTRKKQTTPSA